MSLGPSGSAHLLDRTKEIKAGLRSAAIRATGEDTSALQGHLLSYIDNAMERFKQIQRSKSTQAISPSQVIMMPRSRETDFPDVEMESVGSSQGRSGFGDPGGHTSYESEREDPRRSLLAPAEVSMNQGPSPQRIRFSVIGELKKSNGRD